MEKKKKKPRKLLNDSWSKEDYSKHLTSLISRGCNAQSYRKIKVQEAFDYYYGKSENKEYGELLSVHETTEAYEGMTPFVPLNFDTISPKVNLLLGELNSRGFEISVDATNIESFKRKKVYKDQLQFQMDMQKVFQSAAQFTGQEFGLNDNLPKNDEDLEKFMETYKDAFELIMEEATLESIRAYKYEYLRKNLFLDLLVTNRVHCKLEHRNGYDQFRRINDLNCIYDEMSEDDFQSDQQFFLEAYYMNIPDAIEKFNLPDEVVAEMIENFRGDKANWKGVQMAGQSSRVMFAPFEKKSGSWNDTGFDRILIVSGEWLDIEVFTQKSTYDRYGGLHVHDYEGSNKSAKLTKKEQANTKNSLSSKDLQVVRKATLIGGEHLVDYGKCKTQLRDYSNPETTRLNVISLVHNYNNGESVSMVDRIKGLQDMKNYVLTIAQKEITSNIGNVLYVDKSKIDTETYGSGANAIQNLLGIAKGYGIVVGNSSKDGKFAGMQDGLPFRNIEGRSSAIITECLNVAIFLEEEMNKITGINEARMGQSGERQLASVNSQKLNQSGFVTNTLFHAFNGFEVRLFEQLIYRIANTLADNPERLDILAERLGVDLPEGNEIDLQSYRIHVEAYPLSRQELTMSAQGSLQQGNLTFPEFLRIMYMANQSGGLNKAINKYLTIMDRKEEAAKKSEQAQMQSQMQQVAEGRQFEMAKIQAEIGGKNQGKMQEQELVNKGLVNQGILKNASNDRKTESNERLGNKEAFRKR